MIDLVRPLKMESPGSGGVEDDLFPTEVDPAEDYITAKGISLEGSEDHKIDKDVTGNMLFKDTIVGREVTLQELLGESARKDILIDCGSISSPTENVKLDCGSIV